MGLAHGAEARPMVRHNGLWGNGHRVNIPSYQVRPGDVVEVAEKSKLNCVSRLPIAAAEQRGFPAWIEMDTKRLKAHSKPSHNVPSCLQPSTSISWLSCF